MFRNISVYRMTAGRCSLIGCVSSWYADSRGCDPHIRQNILLLRFCHEKTSMTILSLPLIQEGQLSVTGIVLINCLGGLPRNSMARLTDHVRNDQYNQPTNLTCKIVFFELQCKDSIEQFGHIIHTEIGCYKHKSHLISSNSTLISLLFGLIKFLISWSSWSWMAAKKA